jgi:hypothetical protein
VRAFGELLVHPRFDLDTNLNSVKHDLHAQLGSNTTDRRCRANLSFEASDTRRTQARVRISRQQARDLFCLIVGHEPTT